jgi:hypothetical protein
LEQYLKSQREEDRTAAQLSVQHRYAQGKLRRAAMPPAEKNDLSAGDGARQKLPMRYDE